MTIRRERMRLDRIKLCAIIAKRDLTGVELSKQTGISAQTICAVRWGRSCRDNTGKKLAEALGVDISELLEVVEWRHENEAQCLCPKRPCLTRQILLHTWTLGRHWRGKSENKQTQRFDSEERSDTEKTKLTFFWAIYKCSNLFKSDIMQSHEKIPGNIYFRSSKVTVARLKKLRRIRALQQEAALEGLRQLIMQYR